MDDYLNIALQFPGRAGVLQNARDSSGLIAELGDNYSAYHAFLVRKLVSIGRRPEPEDYGTDFLAFYRDSDALADVVKAEALIRRCRSSRRLGQLAPQFRPDEPTLIDAQLRLVSADTGEPSGEPLHGWERTRRSWDQPPDPPGFKWT